MVKLILDEFAGMPHELLDEHWLLYKDKTYPSGKEFQLPNQKIKELSPYDFDRKKWKKTMEKMKKIKPGQTVTKDGVTATVIDIDGEQICVQDQNGEVQIWMIGEITNEKLS